MHFEGKVDGDYAALSLLGTDPHSSDMGFKMKLEETITTMAANIINNYNIRVYNG